MTETQTTMPIDRMSQSMLLDILRNPLIFKMRHILNYYDTPYSLSAAVGIAAHNALQTYRGGNADIAVPTNKLEAYDIGRENGRKWLHDHIGAINFGKKGTPEEMYRLYENALRFYQAEEPEYHEIVGIEEKISAKMFTLDGQEFPLPGVGKYDILERKANGRLRIVDTKFTKSFTDHDEEDPMKIIQAMFLFYLVRAKYNEDPEDCVFFETKITENSGDNKGKPQTQSWRIDYSHQPYHVLFINIFKDVVEFLKRDPIFLPNVTDPMNGTDAWLMYSQGLISADMSDVEVMHKVKDVSFTSKRFIIHPLDRAENQNLPPEEKIRITLTNMGMPVEYVEKKDGASVVQYRFKIAAGIPVTKANRYVKDIQSALETSQAVRILAPVPGTRFLGVEVASEERTVFKLEAAHMTPGTMMLPVGVTVDGEVIKKDLRSMPHVLVGGATNSGKSVLLNTFITALTQQMAPEAMRLVLIDPKRVELKAYASLPHVEGKILYEYKDCVSRLLRLTDEMEERYKLLEGSGKKDLAEYNATRRSAANKLPYIVVVIDEFADLMLRADDAESVSYDNKTKRWLFKEVLKRANKNREIFIPVENGNTEKMQKHCIGSSSEYDKDSLAEILELHDSLDKTIGVSVEHLIVRLTAMARAVGIHLIIATQSPRVDVIKGTIKANLPTRIALTCTSAIESKIILDTGGAERLNGKGDMIFRHPEVSGDLRLQGLKSN